MNNPKVELIEKERRCYITGDTAMATFLGKILDHIVELEGEISRLEILLENTTEME